ncbi:hypothetical protein EAG_09932 [Camponotus floridanus]|uniref:Uncharacterized protein n=1 Tax=Camponotus floridanus TaxID=104421 RepID=E2A6F6_CAMFO|nr:hypothetical protein EAG_09932 [Camponotus floridanus]
MLNLSIYNLASSINTMVFGSNKFRIRRYLYLQKSVSLGSKETFTIEINSFISDYHRIISAFDQSDEYLLRKRSLVSKFISARSVTSTEVWPIQEVTEPSLGTIRSIRLQETERTAKRSDGVFLPVWCLPPDSIECSPLVLLLLSQHRVFSTRPSPLERELRFSSPRLQGRHEPYRTTFEFIVKSNRRFAAASANA